MKPLNWTWLYVFKYVLVLSISQCTFTPHFHMGRHLNTNIPGPIIGCSFSSHNWVTLKFEFTVIMLNGNIYATVDACALNVPAETVESLLRIVTSTPQRNTLSATYTWRKSIIQYIHDQAGSLIWSLDNCPLTGYTSTWNNVCLICIRFFREEWLYSPLDPGRFFSILIPYTSW
jgi:hypothetical protein